MDVLDEHIVTSYEQLLPPTILRTLRRRTRLDSHPRALWRALTRLI